jgi:hypothetical protein
MRLYIGARTIAAKPAPINVRAGLSRRNFSNENRALASAGALPDGAGPARPPFPGAGTLALTAKRPPVDCQP